MKRHSGFTLIELMVSLLVGLIVIAATIAVYIATVKGSSDTVKSARLNHDLESAMSLMTNDLRRAGYWGGAIAGSDAKDNPFTVITGGTAPDFAPTDVAVMDYTVGGVTHTNGCILYSYDADGDGHYDGNADGDLADADDDAPGDDDRDEFYGFRFGAGAIQMRKTGTTTADCTDGEWEAINVTAGGEAVEITALTFSVAANKCLNVSDAVLCSVTAPGTGDKVVVSREVNVTLNARLLNDTAVTKTLTSNIKIRNNRNYCISPC